MPHLIESLKQSYHDVTHSMQSDTALHETDKHTQRCANSTSNDDVHSSKSPKHHTKLVELVSHERCGQCNTAPSRGKQPRQDTVESAKTHGADSIRSSSTHLSCDIIAPRWNMMTNQGTHASQGYCVCQMPPTDVNSCVDTNTFSEKDCSGEQAKN